MITVVDKLQAVRQSLLKKRQEAERNYSTARIYERKLEYRGKVAAYRVALTKIDLLLHTERAR